MLRRPPAHKESTDFTIGDDSGPAKPAVSASQDLINRTKEWAETFTNGLPNFVCQQSTTRYMEESQISGLAGDRCGYCESRL